MTGRRDTPGSRPMSALEWALVIALSAVWGGSFFFNAVAVAEVPPLTVVAVRVGLAAAVLWAVVLAGGSRMPRDARLWSALLVMGLLNNAIPFGLIVWGQVHVASGLAAILNATTPLFGVVVSHCLTRTEKATPAKVLGVIVGFLGVAAMIGIDALRSLGVDILAQLAVLGAALSYAFAGVFGRRFRAAGLTPMRTATGQVTASAAVLLPVAALVDRPWTLPAPGAEAVGALIGLATACTALAYILYFRILATAGVVNLLLVTFLVPVGAILLGVSFLGEALAPRHLVGMAAIAAGLAAIDGRPLAWLRRRPVARAGRAPDADAPASPQERGR